MIDLPKTKKEAIEKGFKRYSDGKPCRHGHVADKRASTGECWECRRLNFKKWTEKNKDEIIAKRLAYKKEHAERIKEQRAKNYRDNIERERKRNKKYNSENPWIRKSVKAVRKRGMKRAKPRVVSWSEIATVYKLASSSGKTVDHIVPLFNPVVCGLHVPWNMQLMSLEDNLRKSWKFDQEKAESHIMNQWRIYNASTD
ncbi:MAG TPA: hypothetical protein VK171_08825 [Fimbriimonas sp.]|nr:hypothetical protein [Fimbriimonas sp.]